MSGASLIAFVLAVFLPQAFFKLWVERYVDVGRRKDASYFDEIVAPILPSAFLHAQTWVVVHAVCLIRNFLWVASSPKWSFPGVDWKVVFTLANDASVDRLSALLSNWYELMWPLAYVVALALVTFINGVGYGRGALNGIYAKADASLYPGARAAVTPSGKIARLKVYVAAMIFWCWKLVLYETFVSMFPWTILKPYVFVKTKEGALFHGRFETYEKTTQGEIDTIILKQVSRFTRLPIRDALRAGEHPLRPLRGVLVLKWSEIEDINTTTPGEIQRLYKRWEAIRAKDKPAAI